MKLILLGPPGAGKGTQCKRTIDKYSMVHLSSGDILRAERAAGSDLGKKAQSFMDSGALVPDDLIIEMMVKASKGAPDGYVLDGFPRTVVQGQELDKALAAASEKIDAVVSLEIADEIVAGRMTGRRSCPECGAVYHVDYLKSKIEGKCDKDGVDLVQRHDDNPEVVANRLKIYHEQTAAVLGHYEGTDIAIIKVNANQAIEDVTAQMFSELDKL